MEEGNIRSLMDELSTKHGTRDLFSNIRNKNYKIADFFFSQTDRNGTVLPVELWALRVRLLVQELVSIEINVHHLHQINV